MGIAQSDFERGSKENSWLVAHSGFGSPWSQFTLRRYGAGFAATGVSSSIALPRLLRKRLQDWTMRGCVVHLGQNSVSFGRQLDSRSKAGSEFFYGVDIFFGDNSSRASWLWYCPASEWLLQLHHAVLEPLPAPAPSATQSSTVVGGSRWPGQPRFLTDERSTEPAATPVQEEAPAPLSDAEAKAFSTPEPVGGEHIGHQLSMFLSNADGHVGLLCLPVRKDRLEAAEEAVQRWRGTCETPLYWGGRRWKTPEEFARLRESALNMPDLLLLGLETELAMALTPDWTWEKYPRGFGEATILEEQPGDLDFQEEEFANEERSEDLNSTGRGI